MKNQLTVQQAQEKITANLSHAHGVTPEEATFEHYYKAVASIVKDIMADNRKGFAEKAKAQKAKSVYYLCMEFLMGRSLKNSLYNLGLTDVFESALKKFDIRLDRLYDLEPDAGLGNGGLGRLAACYLDALATKGYNAMGYSILYEYGIFEQRIIDRHQIELPDFWLPGGKVWLTRSDESTKEVQFYGNIIDNWDNRYHTVEMQNCTKILAVPYDMYVAGKGGESVSVLRLWSAEAPEAIDMSEFAKGNYTQAMKARTMAEVISKVLYPPDKHYEGQSLRLKQQYFLVSASIQDIIQEHLRNYGTLDNLPEAVAIHINDTHPTLAIPELMRILLDECGYGWDEAWSLVTKTVAYTNHTVMQEALECWSEDLFKELLPRLYQLIKEIDNRYRSYIWNTTHDGGRVERMAIVNNGAVRMANLCVASCHSVNGVSALHSDILKKTLFADSFSLNPEKYTNVTNGIAYRRWLNQSNPELASLITELIGDGFVLNAEELVRLREFENDSAVLERLEKIKKSNKERFAKQVMQKTGIEIDPSSIFDVQVKRLHEYKRQHLNAISILSRYLAIKDNPSGSFVPQTFIFGAKAAPGFDMAKRIITFICTVADLINNDKDVAGRLKVVFMENYNVSLAESLMPAADISEQISLAGYEASGTGNMKLMLNGALTIGTLDGANVEINEAVGNDNMFLFGMTDPEVKSLRGSYNPYDYYQNNAELRRTIDFISSGINSEYFPEVSSNLLRNDRYMVLADFADYRKAQHSVIETWADRERWNRMSLINIACAGRFSADRAVGEYAKNIWHAAPVKL